MNRTLLTPEMASRSRFHFPTRLTPARMGSLPAAEETLDAASGKATTIMNQVLQIWDDLRKRWRAGDQCDVTEYLIRKPDLAASEAAAVDLIYAEYLLWEEAGRSPRREDFLRRFPRYADALRRQLDVHEALSSELPLDDLFADLPAAAESQVESPSIPSTIGKYRIIESLGGGGQAEIYRAVHPTLGKDVALKLGRFKSTPDLPPDPRLVAEGRILAEIEHANLARVYDLDFHEGRPFLVMEYLRGLNLAQYVQQNPLPPRKAAALVAKIARAVAVVHRRGVLHLDIKPQNIVVDEQGEPKLLDFGLARWETPWKDSGSASAGIDGTVAYMPPEQARGDAKRVGPRSDVFALGGVLYYLLTGQSPYGPGGLMEAWNRARQGDYDREALRDKVRSKRLQNTSPMPSRQGSRIVAQARTLSPPIWNLSSADRGWLSPWRWERSASSLWPHRGSFSPIIAAGKAGRGLRAHPSLKMGSRRRRRPRCACESCASIAIATWPTPCRCGPAISCKSRFECRRESTPCCSSWEAMAVCKCWRRRRRPHRRSRWPIPRRPIWRPRWSARPARKCCLRSAGGLRPRTSAS